MKHTSEVKNIEQYWGGISFVIPGDLRWNADDTE